MGSEACGYKTASGRSQWLSRDPMKSISAFNSYLYVQNHPISNVDPLGNCDVQVTETPKTETHEEHHTFWTGWQKTGLQIPVPVCWILPDGDWDCHIIGSWYREKNQEYLQTIYTVEFGMEVCTDLVGCDCTRSYHFCYFVPSSSITKVYEALIQTIYKWVFEFGV